MSLDAWEPEDLKPEKYGLKESISPVAWDEVPEPKKVKVQPVSTSTKVVRAPKESIHQKSIVRGLG